MFNNAFLFENCEHFSFRKKWCRYNKKCIVVFTLSTHDSCQILIKLELSRKLFEKYSNIKFHANPSSGSRGTCGQTDRHEVNTRLFCNFVKALQNITHRRFTLFVQVPWKIQGDTKTNKNWRNKKKIIDRNWTITTYLLRNSNPNYQRLKITSCRWRPSPRMHSFTATTHFKSSRSFVSLCVCCMLCRMRLFRNEWGARTHWNDPSSLFGDWNVPSHWGPILWAL